MTTSTRHQIFKNEIHALLTSGQSTAKVLKVRDDKAPRPHCWIEVWGPDKYSAPTTETESVALSGGKLVKEGECTFRVYAEVAIKADTKGLGLLEDEATRVADALEEALWHGTFTSTYNKDRYDLYINRIIPTQTTWAVDSDTHDGMILIDGSIHYTQIDK